MQVQEPPSHVKERAYPKEAEQEGDAEGYGDLKFNIDETIFAAYEKEEMRKAKKLVIASSDYVNLTKSLFGPDVIKWQELISIGCNQRRWRSEFSDRLK